MFRPAFDLSLDPKFRRLFLYFFYNGIYVFDALTALPGDFLHQVIILFGMQVTEAAVLQFPLDPRDTQPVRQRSIYFNGLPGLLLLFFLGHVFQRVYVVLAVRKLYQYDADVLCHGEEHLSQVLRLLLLFCGIRDFIKLGNAVHKRGNRITELFLYLFKGAIGVFYRIVQKAGNNRSTVHLQIGKDMRDLDRMRDVWFAGLPELAFMSFLRHGVSLVEQLKITDGIILFDFSF